MPRLVHHALEDGARRFPDKTALVCGDRRVSYAQLNSDANRLAKGLIAAGIEPGDRVAILMENSVEAVVSVFGTLKAGAAFTLVSPSTKTDRLRYLLDDERASALITVNDEPRRTVVEALPSGALPAIVAWVGGLPPGSSSGARAWEMLLADGDGEPPDTTVCTEHIGTIIYTSGTSGKPKGVVSLHRDMVFAATTIVDYLGNNPDDVVFCSLPLAFTYGLYQLMTAVTAGATLVLEKNFMFPGHALAVMERERVTGFPGVPTMFSLLLRLDNVATYDLGALRYITNAAAPMAPERIQQVRCAFPRAQFFSMYGQTECKRTCYLPPTELDRRPTSVGVPIPGTDAYVADEDGRPVAPGVVGELVVVGPHLMAGYWGKPEETARRLRRGRTADEVGLYTGDMFRTDHDGYLYFVSRADDIIKTKGEKVSPIEVENAVRNLRGVADVAAVGVPDDVLGQAIKLHIVLEAGAHLTEREVRGFCRQRLEDFMVPSQVEFCDQLPTNENGKTLRSVLREAAN